MLRTILTVIAGFACAAALAAGAALAQSPPLLASFSVGSGVLPYIEQDAFTGGEPKTMSLELSALRADPDVVLSWRAAGPRSGLVAFVDRDGRTLAKYYLESAWPSKVEISGLKASSSEVLIETLTISATGIRRVS
jgi:hypothetical protein